MANWSPEQWVIFFGALSLLITTAITPLVQILTSHRTNKKIEASKKEAVTAANTATVVAKETKEEILKAVKNGHSQEGDRTS